VRDRAATQRARTDETLLVERVGGLLEFNEQPEAPEYLQSQGPGRRSTPDSM
jgi:hypothetical protein